jgi:hypothetical protein
MTHEDNLTVLVEATAASLDERFEALVAGGSRDWPAHADAFVAAAGRHLGAADRVLLPLVRQREVAGREHVDAYLIHARRLERALTRLTGKVHGEAHAASLAWSAVSREVRSALDEHRDAELALVRRLADDLPHDLLGGVAQQVFRAEVRAPTRPHPHLPHTGVLGRATRRVWAVADRFWDTAQGRVVPDPVRPRPHVHDSLVAQYLTADPHFDRSAHLVAHRPRATPAAP